MLLMVVVGCLLKRRLLLEEALPLLLEEDQRLWSERDARLQLDG